MSQLAAAFCIHAPVFETTVALHSTAKAPWRNGDHAVVAAGSSAFCGRSSIGACQSDVAFRTVHEQRRYKESDKTNMCVGCLRQIAQHEHPSAPQNARVSLAGTLEAQACACPWIPHVLPQPQAVAKAFFRIEPDSARR